MYVMHDTWYVRSSMLDIHPANVPISFAVVVDFRLRGGKRQNYQ